MNVTEALKREREKDIVAYNALIRISNGRTNIEVHEILEKNEKPVRKMEKLHRVSPISVSGK